MKLSIIVESFNLTIIIIIVFINPTDSCNRCRTFSYKQHLKRFNFISKLQDSTELSDLALIGTHSSPSYNSKIVDSRWQTQDLTITQQLLYGIRVLDIGIHPRSDIFEIFISNIALTLGFHEVLLETIDFLDNHPEELVILLIHQVNLPASRVSKSNCEILDFYIRFIIKRADRFVKNWRLNETIGEYRGKILLASTDISFRNGKSHCIFNANSCKHSFEVGNTYNYYNKYNNYNSDDKWYDIIGSMNTSFFNYGSCNIIDISFDDGQNGRRAIAQDGGYYCGDVCAHPINYLMVKRFRKPQQVLMIILADFVTQELIDKINDSNF